MTVTITDVRQANPLWFEKGTQRFFGDISYRILHDRDHNPYLVRLTYGWTDMFGEWRQHWKVNAIHGLSIRKLYDQEFATLDEVKQWLRGKKEG